MLLNVEPAIKKIKRRIKLKNNLFFIKMYFGIIIINGKNRNIIFKIMLKILKMIYVNELRYILLKQKKSTYPLVNALKDSI